VETMPAVEELDGRFGIPGVAKISEGNGGLPRIQITGSGAEGEMYLHGAQVTSWKPGGNDEVLFLSTKSRWQEGQAIRGGIPICFPWFRAKRDGLSVWIGKADFPGLQRGAMSETPWMFHQGVILFQTTFRTVGRPPSQPQPARS